MSIIWSDQAGLRLKAGGKSLEYAAWGPEPSAAPTIVLLHEGLGSVAQWRDFPQQLVDATGFGVLAYSRAGYGASDSIELPRPLDYMTREATGTVKEVLDTAGIQQAVLLGHSDGATIAAIYAGSVSDMRIRALVLMAPHFFTEPIGIAAIKAAGDAYANGDLKQKLSKYHADVDVAFQGWYGAWTDPAFESWNVADAIDHLRIPVLAIQGRDDPYGTLAQIQEIETRIYSPIETAILDGCRHAPQQDQPHATLEAIREFCARLDRMEREVVKTA
ncbi:alpha/beta fold hydrolase [Sulfitobacter sp.]|uniref:alpha/beta fold hydrolase n=1 Tax=Sulfitobacter sp. TaxID=1903071 RepID=UPI000C0FA9E4|nr:alpha/beta hydrolase [Roseobacter sp.]MBV49768.1 alpha/beta hydrolase [Roseobacter sp.]PHR08965.1 MAG: alpha/beta hydrolase [Sulfitobacter sp.]